MNIGGLIRDLAVASNTLPQAPMRSALDERESGRMLNSVEVDGSSCPISKPPR